ncbi:hypothetical protein FHX06_002588 [Rhizobium sp. BK512]|nr:hypothetical protein [Rhizobium sp. BK512]
MTEAVTLNNLNLRPIDNHPLRTVPVQAQITLDRRPITP